MRLYAVKKTPALGSPKGRSFFYCFSLPPGYFARFFMVFAIETLVFTPNNPPVILFIRLRGCTESRNETSCNRKG